MGITVLHQLVRIMMRVKSTPLWSVGTVYGHKTEQGDIISSTAIIPYGKKLAFIGTFH